MGKAKLVQFNPRTAQVLMRILELEGEQVTKTSLIESLRGVIGEDIIRRFLKEAEDDPREFITFTKWLGANGGRPTALLSVEPDRIITNPLSALILIELKNFQGKAVETSRQEFLEFFIKKFDHLGARYPRLQQEINERITFLIEIGDIGTGKRMVPDAIWAELGRYFSQYEYLKILQQSGTFE